MTNKATKYGLMTIAAVLLVAMAFAGAASADKEITSQVDYISTFSVSSLSGDTYYIKGSDWAIPSLHNLSDEITITGDVILDFTNFTGIFEGITDATDGMCKGGLFGNVTLDDKNLDIIGLNMTSVTITSGNNTLGGIIGYVNGTGSFNITNCHLSDCMIGNATGIGTVGGFVGSTNASNVKLTIAQCSLMNCNVICNSSYVGGLFGCINFLPNVTITQCKLTNSNIISNSSGLVGGLVSHIKNANVTVTQCEATNCNVTGGGGNVGGILGEIDEAYNVEYCTLTNCNVTGGGRNVGGLLGNGYSDSSKLLSKKYRDMNYCNVTRCVVSGGGRDVGGMIGHEYVEPFGGSPIFPTCTVKYCNVSDTSVKSERSWNVGGVFGYIFWTYAFVEHCNVLNCDISTPEDSVGGVIGFAKGNSFTAENCKVENSNVFSGTYGSGGIIGVTSDSFTVEHCEVVNCNTISGLYKVGGLVGEATGNPAKINNSIVRDSTITGRAISSDSTTIGGIVGSTVTNPLLSEMNNNILENVQIQVADGGDAQYAYLFDVTKYPINSTNGIAKVSQINLSNGNKIIDSYVLDGYSGMENTKLEGFDTLKEEFNLTVSNPHVTSIGIGAFKNSYLTDITEIESITSIGEYAFENCTNMTGGFYVPGTVTIDPTAFKGTDNLKVIYGNTTGFTEYSIETALVNITSFGTIGNINSGTFAVSGPEVFKTIKLGLGSSTANKFKNLTDGTDLLASASWTPGNAYYAFYQSELDPVNNVSVFGGDNFTVIRNNDSINSNLLVSVNNVTGTVKFTADNTTVSSVLPSISGMNAPITVSIFDITADNDGSGTKSTIYLNVTFSDLADKDKVKFFQYTDESGWGATPLTSSIVTVYTSENTALYKVETTSFSPFGIGIYTAIPQQYTPSSSSKQTGSTIILLEGQTAPTAYATATPTVAPTAKPTEKPATPTVIATEKPTTQATETQKSPAPVIGIIVGLGAAAVLLRLRK